MNKIFQITKDAGYTLAGMSDELRNTVLNRVADAIVANASMLLEPTARTLSAWSRATLSMTGCNLRKAASKTLLRTCAM